MKIDFQFHFFVICSVSVSIFSIMVRKALASSYLLQSLPCFLILIPGVLDPSVNFRIPKRFLCRRPVFPDDISVSCDYDDRL